MTRRNNRRQKLILREDVESESDNARERNRDANVSPNNNCKNNGMKQQSKVDSKSTFHNQENALSNKTKRDSTAASSTAASVAIINRETTMNGATKNENEIANKSMADAPKAKFRATKSLENETKMVPKSSYQEDEEPACCLCHCGVDCSDRSLFFAKDRKLELEEDEDYYFGLDDPYLDGDKFYDPNNALVYCDSCNRLYHQKCHFVPLLVLPRGDFHCLICSIQQEAVRNKERPSKKRRKESTSGNNSLLGQSLATQENLLNRKITDQLFQSPPRLETAVIQSLQREWELGSASFKARFWDRQLKQLKRFLVTQSANIRMANTTLATMTSTKRNRQHFLLQSGTKSSQELAQTLCKLTGAKCKIREALLSLESLRKSDEPIDFSSLVAWCQEYPQHANHIFPFGSNLYTNSRRIIPRTRERQLSSIKEEAEKLGQCRMSKNRDKKAIPSEILVNSASKCPSSSCAVAKRSKASMKDGEKKNNRSTSKISDEKNNDDSDSGISLDDLQCCICMIGDSTDENDLILCDGKDCHRAYHMKCIYPCVTAEELENELEDFFCPICSNLSRLIGEVHDLCIGDDDEYASSGSWEDVEDVFPNSKWEYETALKILKGKRNEDTQRLMAMFLGEGICEKQSQMPVGSDSEDENDYSLFDEDSFEERKRKEREQEEDSNLDEDDTTRSSQVTLQGMAGIEYEVGKAELAALSEEEKSEKNSDDESEADIRRSRRLLKRGEEVDENNTPGADFSETNIIHGKRKRRRVNYRKLNDMMFGDLSDREQELIDGGEDFDADNIQLTKTKSDDNSNDNGQEDDSDSQ